MTFDHGRALTLVMQKSDTVSITNGLSGQTAMTPASSSIAMSTTGMATAGSKMRCKAGIRFPRPSTRRPTKSTPMDTVTIAAGNLVLVFTNADLEVQACDPVYRESK